MRLMILVMIIGLCTLTGCNKTKCTCGSVKCGPDCYNKCEENRCYPGTPCCDKCICRFLSK